MHEDGTENPMIDEGEFLRELDDSSTIVSRVHQPDKYDRLMTCTDLCELVRTYLETSALLEEYGRRSPVGLGGIKQL